MKEGEELLELHPARQDWTTPAGLPHYGADNSSTVVVLLLITYVLAYPRVGGVLSSSTLVE